MSKALNNIDLTAAERKEVAALLQRYLPDTEVWAYGSRVKFTAKPHSDLDMVAFASKEQSQAVANLREAFEESYLPFRVDLFVWDEVPEGFYGNIEEVRVVVQEKKHSKNQPNNWKILTLSKIINLIGGGTPKRSKQAYWNGNIPWLSVKDFNNQYRYVDSAEETITELGEQESSTRVLKTGQLIISARGTVGALAQLTQPMAFNQSCYGIDAKREYTDNDFLYYLIKHSIDNLKQITHGAVFDTITRETFNHIEVSLPPPPQQKAIAHILGSLDDKIELNRRMNETLEAMAQALFKSWFVDFDPVIDNALTAGNAIPDELKEKAAIRQRLGDKQKSLPDDIRRLFPSEFAYTEEMGWIPKGWEIKNLDQIGVFKNGLALQKFPPIEGEEILPVVKIAQLRKGNTTGSDLFASRIADDFIINDGDFIFSWSGSLLAKFWVGGKGALNQHLFKVEGKEHPLWFVAGWVHQHMPEFCAIAENKATTMGHIKKEHLSQAQCIGPGQKILKKLESCIAPLVNRQIFVQQESRALTELRDTLLLKLLSGEICVTGPGKSEGDLCQIQ